MLNNIQISRGVAASIVVLAHANLIIEKSLFDGFLIIGWCGVDFFFVLSGFIIFYTSRANLYHPEAAPAYFLKRFRRVYPIYWLYTLAALLMYAVVMRVLGKDVLNWADKSWSGILGNLLLLPTDVPANSLPILPVAWTLTYEITFYALFGVAILVKPRVSLAICVAWIFAIALRVAGLFGDISPTSFAYILTQTRNIEFLLGCAAAYLVTSGKIHVTTRRGLILLTIGLALLCAAWTNAHFGFRWMNLVDFVQFGVPFFLIVLGVVAIDLTKPKQVGHIRRSFIFLGDASYSIYLTHFIVIDIVGFVARNAKLSTPLAFSASVLVSLGIGCLAYRYVERPLIAAMSGRPRNLAFQLISPSTSSSKLP